MQVLKSFHELDHFLKIHDCRGGFLADTGFLYAAAYQDDRFHNAASEVLDLLSDYKIPIYSNVITRMEFIDLIFRKQLTSGAIKLFNSLLPASVPKSLFNL